MKNNFDREGLLVLCKRLGYSIKSCNLEQQNLQKKVKFYTVIMYNNRNIK